MNATVTMNELPAAAGAAYRPLYRRLLDAMIASRAKAAAREILRHQRRAGRGGGISETDIAREIAALYGAGRLSP